MENSSTSTLSPAWPTRWPQDAFKPGPVAFALLVAVGALLVGGVLSAIYMAVADPAFLPTRKIHDVAAAMIASAIVELPVAVVALLFLPRISRFSLRELGFVRPKLSALAIAAAALIAGLIAEAAGTAVVTAITHAPPHEQMQVQMFLSIRNDPWKVALFAIFAAAFAPFAEEVFFRAFLFNLGLRYGGFWIGAIVSSTLFGFAHGSVVEALPLALVGVALCAAYYLTRNIYASMIAHGTFNLLTLVVLLYAPKLAGG